MVITKYLSILQQYYYLDSNDILRYKHDGYHNRYKVNDTVAYSVHGGYKLACCRFEHRLQLFVIAI